MASVPLFPCPTSLLDDETSRRGSKPGGSAHQRPQSRPSGTHDTALAARYRTSLCETFAASGACPYEWRCMFAHGEHELRTKEMNVASGLVTDAAVKAFQRELFVKSCVAKRRAKRRASGAGAEASNGQPQQQPATASTVATGQNIATSEPRTPPSRPRTPKLLDRHAPPPPPAMPQVQLLVPSDHVARTARPPNAQGESLNLSLDSLPADAASGPRPVRVAPCATASTTGNVASTTAEHIPVAACASRPTATQQQLLHEPPKYHNQNQTQHHSVASTCVRPDRDTPPRVQQRHRDAATPQLARSYDSSKYVSPLAAVMLGARSPHTRGVTSHFAGSSSQQDIDAPAPAFPSDGPGLAAAAAAVVCPVEATGASDETEASAQSFLVT